MPDPPEVETHFEDDTTRKPSGMQAARLQDGGGRMNEQLPMSPNSGPSQFDIDHMEEIIAGKTGDWFSADLLRLIRKADLNNRARLRCMFPNHVKAFEDWYYGTR